jgi:hypothetical protein
MFTQDVTKQDAEQLLAECRAKGLTEVDVVWRLLSSIRTTHPWYQRQSNEGAGNVRSIEIKSKYLRVITWNDELFDFVEERGYRWREVGGLWISRSRLEEQLGVWPGYVDGLEDVFYTAQEFLDEFEQEKHQYKEQLENRYEMFEEQLEYRYAIERHPELRRWRARNPSTATNIPVVLQSIRHIKQIETSHPCYVYFLLKDSEVVYVGQSSAPWPTRILQHIKEETKSFDDVWYLEVDRRSLSEVEQSYIRKFSPIYNRQGKNKRLEL